MHNLLDFLRKYAYFFLFLLLESLSLLLLFRFNHYQGSVAFSAANAAVARVETGYAEALAYLQLQGVNRQLTEENMRLQMQTNRLREALMTATRDTCITQRLMMERLADYELIAARVVQNSQGYRDNYIVIDRGTTDGVQPEMGVVGGGGVVGIVYLTGPHYSLVIPVTNRKSSISCRVRGQNYFGYLHWDGRSMTRATVDDIPRYARVKPGEVVETSGYSAVFPPGIFVGRVRTVSNSADGQSYKLDVVLGTHFANLRDVMVVKTPYKAEIDTLQAQLRRAERPQ